MPATAPYGSWKSPITTALIVSGAVGLGQIALDGDDVYWVEMRPAEGGRMVIVRRDADGETVDLTPQPFSVRTRVHEYGGSAFLVSGGVVFFSNFADQRLYRQAPGDEPRAITPETALRYADGVFDARRRCIVCVREDHSGEGGAGQRHRGGGRGGRATPGDAVCWFPTSALLPGSAPMAARWPGWPGITPICRGTEPPCCWPTLTRLDVWASRRWWLAGRTSQSCNRSGRRMVSFTSSPTAADGGTCTAGASARFSPCRKWMPSLPVRSGCSTLRPTASWTTGASPAASSSAACGISGSLTPERAA